jgi:hypothetical protein
MAASDTDEFEQATASIIEDFGLLSSGYPDLTVHANPCNHLDEQSRKNDCNTQVATAAACVGLCAYSGVGNPA